MVVNYLIQCNAVNKSIQNINYVYIIYNTRNIRELFAEWAFNTRKVFFRLCIGILYECVMFVLIEQAKRVHAQNRVVGREREREKRDLQPLCIPPSGNKEAAQLYTKYTKQKI